MLEHTAPPLSHTEHDDGPFLGCFSRHFKEVQPRRPPFSDCQNAQNRSLDALRLLPSAPCLEKGASRISFHYRDLLTSWKHPFRKCIGWQGMTPFRGAVRCWCRFPLVAHGGSLHLIRTPHDPTPIVVQGANIPFPCVNKTVVTAKSHGIESLDAPELQGR